MKTLETTFENYHEAKDAIYRIENDLEAIGWLGQLQRTFDYLSNLQRSDRYRGSGRDAAADHGFSYPEYVSLKAEFEARLSNVHVVLQIAFVN